jgi:hypothetical protein
MESRQGRDGHLFDSKRRIDRNDLGVFRSMLVSGERLPWSTLICSTASAKVKFHGNPAVC